MVAAEILYLEQLSCCLPVTPLKCPTEDKSPKKFANWVDEDDVDITELAIPEDESDIKMPVYSMNDHICSPWEEET